jgi:hypothetical protein
MPTQDRTWHQTPTIQPMRYEPSPAESGSPTAVALPALQMVPVVEELPVDPELSARVRFVLQATLEAFDGRRPLRMLTGILAPQVIRYLRAASEMHRTTGRVRGRVTRLGRVRVCPVASGVAEVAAVVVLNSRPLALAARFEQDRSDTWTCTELRLLR